MGAMSCMRETLQRLPGLVFAAAALLLGACSADEPAPLPGRTSPDNDPEGLYHDFLEGGKYDGMGHPYGADVFEAETDCRLETGGLEAEGIAARPGTDAPGLICALRTPSIGVGRYILNLRTLLQDFDCPADGCVDDTPVVTARVLADDGTVLAAGSVPFGRYLEPLLFENTSFQFTNRERRELVVEVAWEGFLPVRIDYLEIFQDGRRLTLSPASGVPGAEDQLLIEITDFPEQGDVGIWCNGTDLSTRFEELLTSGEAVRGDTEFRTLFTAPLAPFLEGCGSTASLKVSAREYLVELITSRVTFYDEPPACGFEPDTTAVLLTGFEPFPADSVRDNSSMFAVTGFDGSMFAGVSFMPLVLPVEWDTAPGMVVDVMGRCRPDIVISFGQGGLDVAVETTAYNLKDTASIAGGVPDNRGVIYAADPIVPDGPALLHTRLDAEDLVDELRGLGVNARPSDNPGRYVCNNVFYTVMHALEPYPGLVGGFVHLPRVYEVDPETAQLLQTVVEAAVGNALQVYAP
jgi:pyroglutamyl-peptidase